MRNVVIRQHLAFLQSGFLCEKFLFFVKARLRRANALGCGRRWRAVLAQGNCRGYQWNSLGLGSQLIVKLTPQALEGDGVEPRAGCRKPQPTPTSRAVLRPACRSHESASQPVTII